MEWARYRGFEPAAHHQLIIGEIESFLDSDDEVLLLFAPPGLGQEHLRLDTVSRRITLRAFPATASLRPRTRWSSRSAGAGVSETTSPLDSQLLGIELAADSQASDRWALRTGGEYYGVGAGVGISGFRADLGLGDDFFGSREDAWSRDRAREAMGVVPSTTSAPVSNPEPSAS